MNDNSSNLLSNAYPTYTLSSFHIPNHIYTNALPQSAMATAEVFAISASHPLISSLTYMHVSCLYLQEKVASDWI